MNGTRSGVRSYLTELKGSEAWARAGSGLELALYLPATLLVEAAERAERIHLGGQTLHSAQKGAYTGEVSGAQLRDAGATTVLVGHSERRALFGESDQDVAARLAAALREDLRPVLCVGEDLSERRAGTAEDKVCSQLDACAEEIRSAAGEVIIAYEPVWAIGTGETATPETAQAMHRVIRRWLAGISSAKSETTRLLYGGSVSPENAGDLLAEPDIDGALVGGASLTAESFAAIGAAVLANRQL